VAEVSLPKDVEASYSAIIDEILRASDINTISAKRIRKGLQERVKEDLTQQKVWSLVYYHGSVD
jgi:upstream activation factor subunit UAF30